MLQLDSFKVQARGLTLCDGFVVESCPGVGAEDPFGELGSVLEHFTLVGAQGLGDQQPIASLTGERGTVLNQPVASFQPLHEDGAQVYDGIDDRLDAGDIDAMRALGAQACTIGFSFRYAAASWSTTRRIFSTAAGASTPGTYLIFTGSSSFLFGISGAGYPIRLTGTTGLADTAWHRCVIQHDGATAELWIDGVSRGSQAFRAPYDPGDPEPFTLGASTAGNFCWDGKVLDFIAYTGADVDVAALDAVLAGRLP